MFQTTHYVKLLDSGRYTLARRSGKALFLFWGLGVDDKPLILRMPYDRRRFQLLPRVRL